MAISLTDTALAGNVKSATGFTIRGTALAIVFAAASWAAGSDLDSISQRVTSQLLSSLPSTATVQGYMNGLQANGSWSDIDYSNTSQTNWLPLPHLQRLESMAQLYSSSGSSLYQNATLGSDISNAFNYWISVDPMSTNWFDNDIATPQDLGATMVLVSKSILSASQISSGQIILARAKANIPSQTGQNVVDEAIAGIYSSIVSGSSANMSNAFGSIGGTIQIVAGNGIQADHSYMFHGPQLYMGGYGTSYAKDTLQWGSIGAGTNYALTAAQERLLVDYLLDGTQWFIRGRTMDLTADGRQATFPSYVGAGDGFVSSIQYALALGTYRQAELQAFLARQQATISSVPPVLRKTLCRAISAISIPKSWSSSGRPIMRRSRLCPPAPASPKPATTRGWRICIWGMASIRSW